jgi:molybdopterin-guanine dinucleotide biosynthesis protein A
MDYSGSQWINCHHLSMKIFILNSAELIWFSFYRFKTNQPMITEDQVTWVILAGGKSSRMGGTDKGLLIYRGKPLIQHVVDSLKPQASHIWICANRNIQDYQAYAPVIQDVFPQNPGPLAGLHTALTHTETNWVGILPCDGPIVSPDLIERFCHATKIPSRSYVAYDGERLQPVYAMVHHSLLEELEQYLARGERKVICFFKQSGIVRVDCQNIRSMFININTPEQLQ